MIGLLSYSGRSGVSSSQSRSSWPTFRDRRQLLSAQSSRVAVVGGSVTTHNLLSPTHPDTVSTSPARGDLLYGNSTLLWDRLAIGAAGTYLSSDGTDPSWVAPAALTKVDDTNVTLTLGGTPASSLFAAVSLTLGWTGSLATTRGGTGIATYTLGDILYSNAADSLAKLAGNITATKQFLTQTGTGAASAAPVWAALVDADIPDILRPTSSSCPMNLSSRFRRRGQR